MYVWRHRWVSCALLAVLFGLLHASPARADKEDLKNPYVVGVQKEKKPRRIRSWDDGRADDADDEADEADDEAADRGGSDADDEAADADDEAAGGGETFDDDADFGGSADEAMVVEGEAFGDFDELDDPGVEPASSGLDAGVAETNEDPGLVDFRVGGWAAADGRVFFGEPVHPGQKRGDAVSLVVEPELAMDIDAGAHIFTARPFYRLDPIDPNRSHFDVRRGEYRISMGGFEGGLGIGQFRWGALEFHRPSDVINQVDFVESIDGMAKLGQPYVELGYIGEDVALRVMYLPHFRERTFHGIQGRLRFPVVVAGESSFESALQQWHPSGAARFSAVAGDFDLGLGVFTGLSREPRFIAQVTSGELSPRYDLMHQASADASWTYGPVSLKAEGYFRLWSKELRYFGGAGGGIDYTLFDMFGSGADLTFVGEFLWDNRPPEAPVTFFEHDAFGGLRLSIGDVGSTTFQGGVVVDVLDATMFGRASAQRRFGDHWVVALDGLFFRSPPEKLEAGLAGDNHVAGRVAYHF